MTITLGSRLEISSPMEVVGSGVGSAVVDGGGRDIVFFISAGDVALRGLTIRGGDAQLGGGAFVSTGSRIEISDARITDNEAFTGGGGLFVGSGATATLQRTTIDGNRAVGAFGGGSSTKARCSCTSP